MRRAYTQFKQGIHVNFHGDGKVRGQVLGYPQRESPSPSYSLLPRDDKESNDCREDDDATNDPNVGIPRCLLTPIW